MIRLEGVSSADTELQMQIASEACLASGAEDVLIAANKEQEAAIWDCRSAFLAAVKSGSEVDECDVVVPRNRIAEFVAYSQKYRLKSISGSKVLVMLPMEIYIFMFA